MRHCYNCHQPVHGAYCSHCGQKYREERLSFHWLLHEIFHFFTHIESGFLFTTWRMIVKPGSTVTGFIKGERKKFQSPISYFLIWITIYILFLYWIEKIFGQNTVIDYSTYFGEGSATRFAISHLGLVLIFIIPFQALFLKIFVTGPAYNYCETVVCTFYSLGTIIVMQFLFAVLALIGFMLFGMTQNLLISDILKVIYISWFAINVVKKFQGNLKWIRALAFVLMAFGTFTLWRILGYPLFVKYAFGGMALH